jgi:diguanylate cyclase (GGDEF)-like protein
MGIGVWSMHYLGMLAVSMPVPVDYYVPTVVLSLLLAVAASAVTLSVVGAKVVGWKQQIVGGLLMGAGIGGMHYTGMAAMRSSAIPMYSGPVVAISIVAAVVFSVAALRLASEVRNAGERAEGLRIAAGAVMGLAIASMHYIAMSAVHFVPSNRTYSPRDTVHIGALGQIGVSVTAAVVLLVALLSADLDKRLYLRLRKAHGQLATSRAALMKSEKALQEANSMLRELSVRDGLTGLYNRRHFDERFVLEWRRALRSRRPLSLLLLDIDHFKRLNDQYGHQYGDDCLREVAAILADHTRRAEDLAARFGGEEFVVLLPSLDLAAARRVAEEIRSHLVERAIEHKACAAGIVTLSVGVAGWTPTEGDLPETMIRCADEALYEAKRGGRDRVCVAGSGASMPHCEPSSKSPAHPKQA